MSDQIKIPCLFMRGGTSRGPYFLKSDLPSDIEQRDKILLAAMGSPDIRQIDGLGGADPVKSKVAIISKSEEKNIDVDYHFAQVKIDEPIVDTKPSCGNMLIGVGPASVERGLVNANNDKTKIVIRDVNTGMKIEEIVQTPGGEVSYDGDFKIDGVPNTGTPVEIRFLDSIGAKTKKLPGYKYTLARGKGRGGGATSHTAISAGTPARPRPGRAWLLQLARCCAARGLCRRTSSARR